jgi:hypothetical protein
VGRAYADSASQSAPSRDRGASATAATDHEHQKCHWEHIIPISRYQRPPLIPLAQLLFNYFGRNIPVRVTERPPPLRSPGDLRRPRKATSPLQLALPYILIPLPPKDRQHAFGREGAYHKIYPTLRGCRTRYTTIHCLRPQSLVLGREDTGATRAYSFGRLSS